MKVRSIGVVGALLGGCLVLISPTAQAGEDPWTPGVYPVDSGVCVPAAGSQGTLAFFRNPMLTAPVPMDTLYADGHVTPAGHRRVDAQVAIGINTVGICGAQAPDARVMLQTKMCEKKFLRTSCEWATIAERNYTDLPVNGRRVSHMIEGYARPGSHHYRLVVSIGGLSQAESEEGAKREYLDPNNANKGKKRKSNHGRAPGGFGELEYAHFWSSTEVRLEYSI